MRLIKPNPILPSSPFEQEILAHLKKFESSVNTMSGLLEEMSTMARVNVGILIAVIILMVGIAVLLAIMIRKWTQN